jgi:coiled-coil and C2 domain-containing protein 1
LNIPINGDRDTIYKHLLEKLKQQVDIATENFKHYSKMGDIPNANKFKVTARESIADYEALKNADRLKEPVPLYHYEKRSYDTIDCNSDLTDNDLEITVIRGINYIIPKDYKVDHMNTFVKFEFPYPPVGSFLKKYLTIILIVKMNFFY